MLTFSAIVPHSPLLLPAIGKEHCRKLKKTVAAYQLLGEALALAKPDTVLILSAHAGTLPDSFPLIIAPRFRANFQEFGDLTTKLECKPDLKLIEEIRRLRYDIPPVPINPLTEEFMDYGSAVPLHILTATLPKTKVAILGDSQFSLEKHFELGRHLAEIIHQSPTRMAILASADLAHTLTDSAPGDYSPVGKKFDEAVVQALRKDDYKKLLKLETQMTEAKVCGLRVIVMLFGILRETHYTSKILSYEGPFGVGYLTVNFIMQ